MVGQGEKQLVQNPQPQPGAGAAGHPNPTPSFDLAEMVDLALCSPEVGAVNFNILRILLHELLGKLGVSQEKAALDPEKVQYIQKFKNYIDKTGKAAPLPGVLRYNTGDRQGQPGQIPVAKPHIAPKSGRSGVGHPSSRTAHQAKPGKPSSQPTPSETGALELHPSSPESQVEHHDQVPVEGPQAHPSRAAGGKRPPPPHKGHSRSQSQQPHHRPGSTEPHPEHELEHPTGAEGSEHEHPASAGSAPREQRKPRPRPTSQKVTTGGAVGSVDGQIHPELEQQETHGPGAETQHRPSAGEAQAQVRKESVKQTGGRPEQAETQIHPELAPVLSIAPLNSDLEGRMKTVEKNLKRLEQGLGGLFSIPVVKNYLHAETSGELAQGEKPQIPGPSRKQPPPQSGAPVQTYPMPGGPMKQTSAQPGLPVQVQQPQGPRPGPAQMQQLAPQQQLQAQPGQPIPQFQPQGPMHPQAQFQQMPPQPGYPQEGYPVQPMPVPQGQPQYPGQIQPGQSPQHLLPVQQQAGYPMQQQQMGPGGKPMTLSVPGQQLPAHLPPGYAPAQLPPDYAPVPPGPEGKVTPLPKQQQAPTPMSQVAYPQVPRQGGAGPQVQQQIPAQQGQPAQPQRMQKQQAPGANLQTGQAVAQPHSPETDEGSQQQAPGQEPPAFIIPKMTLDPGHDFYPPEEPQYIYQEPPDVQQQKPGAQPPPVPGAQMQQGGTQMPPPQIQGKQPQVQGKQPQLQGQPQQMQGQPPQMQGKQPQMQSQPQQMQGQPQQMQGQPPQLQGQPPQLQGQPQQLQGQPQQMQGQPPQLQGQPQQMQGQPPPMQGKQPQMQGQPLQPQGKQSQMQGQPPQMQGKQQQMQYPAGQQQMQYPQGQQIQYPGPRQQPLPIQQQPGYPMQPQPMQMQQGYPMQPQPMQTQGYPIQPQPMQMQQGYPMQPQQMQMQQGYPMQPQQMQMQQGYPMQPQQMQMQQGYPMQPQQMQMQQGYPMQPIPLQQGQQIQYPAQMQTAPGQYQTAPGQYSTYPAGAQPNLQGEQIDPNKKRLTSTEDRQDHLVPVSAAGTTASLSQSDPGPIREYLSPGQEPQYPPASSSSFAQFIGADPVRPAPSSALSLGMLPQVSRSGSNVDVDARLRLMDKKLKRLEKGLGGLFAIPIVQNFLNDDEEEDLAQVAELMGAIELNNRVSSIEEAIIRTTHLMENFANELANCKCDANGVRRDAQHMARTNSQLSVRLDPIDVRSTEAFQLAIDLKKELESMRTVFDRQIEKLMELGIGRVPSYIGLTQQDMGLHVPPWQKRELAHYVPSDKPFTEPKPFPGPPCLPGHPAPDSYGFSGPDKLSAIKGNLGVDDVQMMLNNLSTLEVDTAAIKEKLEKMDEKFREHEDKFVSKNMLDDALYELATTGSAHPAPSPPTASPHQPPPKTATNRTPNLPQPESQKHNQSASGSKAGHSFHERVVPQHNVGGGAAAGLGIDDVQIIFNHLSNLVIEHSAVKERLDKVDETFKEMENLMVSKNMMVDALNEKADKIVLNTKVNYDEFGTSMDELKSRLQNLLVEVYSKNENWKSITDRIQDELTEKLDKIEIGPLRAYFKNHLGKLEEKVHYLTRLIEEPDPAGTRKKFLKDYNCLSCDRHTNISGVTNTSLLPVVPPMLGGYSTASQRAFGLYQMRGNKNSEMDPNRKGQDDNRGDGIVNGAHSLRDTEVAHLVNRYVGGSHTAISSGDRLAALHNKTIPTSPSPYGVQVQFTDGTGPQGQKAGTPSPRVPSGMYSSEYDEE